MGNPTQPNSDVSGKVIRWFTIIGGVVFICFCGYLVVFKDFRLSNEQEIFGIRLAKPSETPTQLSTDDSTSTASPTEIMEIPPNNDDPTNFDGPQKVCGPEAFVNGSYYTESPTFQSNDGYTSGWLTTDPADLRLADGTIQPLKSRTVIIVDNVSEVSLENVAVSDGHAQISGCWFRDDLTIDVRDEAESEFLKMQDAEPDLPLSLRVISPDGLDTVSDISLGQSILVRREYTGAGNLVTYSGYLPEFNIIAAAGSQIETVSGCALYVINGPMDFSFQVRNGYWQQHIITSSDQKQKIIEDFYEILGNLGCPAGQIQLIENP